MPRGIPNKKKDMIAEIENEMNSFAVQEKTLETGEVSIAKDVPLGTKGSNEFGEEYTMEVIADFEDGADTFRVPNKDPKFEYRFLRDTKENLSVKTSNLLMLKGGWQICPKTHLLRIGVDSKVLHPDGSYRVGELVLAFMPKEYFEKKMSRDRKVANSAMAGVKRLVEEGDSSRVNIKDVNAIRPGRMDGGRIVFDKQAKGSVKVKSYGSHNQIDD